MEQDLPAATVTIVLDSEAVSLLARRDVRIQQTMTAALAMGERVVVPALVLAEIMTGKPSDAAVWHVVGRLVTQNVTAKIAARAGALREKATLSRAKKRDLTVDAVVAATAEIMTPVTILTGDPNDFCLLTSGLDIQVLAIG